MFMNRDMVLMLGGSGYRLVGQMILQPFLAKEFRKFHEIRLLLIDIPENHTHGMTDVGMMYMTGSGDALDQVMAVVTYDVIGSASPEFSAAPILPWTSSPLKPC